MKGNDKGTNQQSQQNVEVEGRYYNLGVWFANERLRWLSYQKALKENRPAVFIPWRPRW